MSNLHTSIYSYEHQKLRDFLIIERKKQGLSQRDLVEKMGVIYSFIGKVETGDRRIDIFEFIYYCRVLSLSRQEVLSKMEIWI